MTARNKPTPKKHSVSKREARRNGIRGMYRVKCQHYACTECYGFCKDPSEFEHDSWCDVAREEWMSRNKSGEAKR